MAELDWTAPEGMSRSIAQEWRAFYRSALRTYGITPVRYRNLYLAQKGRCWICRTASGKHPDDPKGRGGRRLGVDHNHATGQVRGLLCTGGDKTCNRVIGWLNAAGLRRAADYLDGTKTPGVVLTGDTPEDMSWAMAVLWGDQVLPSVPVIPGYAGEDPAARIKGLASGGVITGKLHLYLVGEHGPETVGLDD